MAVIITAHIAQSSSSRGRSHVGDIIQALAPVMGPYMSRAIATIHIHAAMGNKTTSTTSAARSCRKADSRIVSGRSSEGAYPTGRSISENTSHASVRC